MKRRRALVAGVVASALHACAEAPPPPYGFGAAPEQRFRFHAEDQTEIDGTPVHVQRFAELRLVGDAASEGNFELVLRLDRYYLRVEGAPGGPTELALSNEGVVTRGVARGDVEAPPREGEPGSSPLAGLLESPVGGVILEASGAGVGTPWRSQHPVLEGIDVLDWVLLALPVVEPGDDAVWSGSRELPPIGQYRFGLELPIRYERAPAGEGVQIKASGVARRERVEITEGLAGAVEVDFASESDLGPAGRMLAIRLQLSFRFDGEGGTRVASVHRVELVCQDCQGVPEPEVNPPAGEADSSSG